MKVHPSVMGKDQTQVNKLFKKLEGVTKHIHLDVADNLFVPNSSLWFPFRLSSKFTYSVHLMVADPYKWVARFGHRVDSIIFHQEINQNQKELIDLIKSKEKEVGIALKPETKVDTIKDYLKFLDYVLILTVNPGFYGSAFLPTPLKKIKQLKELNFKGKIIVDGGIDQTTIKEVKNADILISGHFVSQADNPRSALAKLYAAVKK